MTAVCPLGGILCSIILDKFGRKITLMIVNFLSITSWGIIGFAHSTDFDMMLAQLMVARIIIGKFLLKKFKDKKKC